MRGKILGYLAAILCGTAIFITGFSLGEIQRHQKGSKMYFDGYRTGYIKGFRRVRNEVMKQNSINIEPLNLNANRRIPSDKLASDSSAISQD